jgi:hypothetical protein
MNTLTSRKFLLTVGCQLLTTILVFMDKIDGDTYGWVTVGVLGAYVTGNVVQKLKTGE